MTRIERGYSMAFMLLTIRTELCLRVSISMLVLSWTILSIVAAASVAKALCVLSHRWCSTTTSLKCKRFSLILL